MLDRLLEEMNEEASSNIVIYSNNKGELSSIIFDLEYNGVNVHVEGYKDCMVDIEKCIIETLKDKYPSVVIIDNDFENSGIKLLKMIKDEGIIKNIPIIFLGFEDTNAKLQVLNLGAFDYLEKPFNKTELFIKTKNLLEVGRKFINYRVFDSLTGVYSHKYGKILSEQVFNITRLENMPYTVLAIDIENMARINEALGKERGAIFLKEFSDILKANLNIKEFIYRYSEEKLIMILPGKNAVETLQFSEKMQLKIDTLAARYKVEISFTAGIASFNSNSEDEKDVVSLALQSLYDGKEDGKGRTYVHLSSIEESYKKNILILDQDEIILTILKQRYIHKGYEVFTAQSWKTALSIVSNRNVDLIISDYAIQGMACSELIKSSKDINKNIKIIVLSGQKNESFIEIALNAGADDCITKPFSPVELDLRIQKLLK